MAKAKQRTQRKSVEGENAAAAFDRLIALSAGQGTIGSDAKALYQRVMDVTAEFEDYVEDATAALAQEKKDHENDVRKLATKVADLQAENDKLNQVFRAVHGTITSK